MAEREYQWERYHWLTDGYLVTEQDVRDCYDWEISIGRAIHDAKLRVRLWRWWKARHGN